MKKQVKAAFPLSLHRIPFFKMLFQFTVFLSNAFLNNFHTNNGPNKYSYYWLWLNPKVDSKTLALQDTFRSTLLYIQMWKLKKASNSKLCGRLSAAFSLNQFHVFKTNLRLWDNQSLPCVKAHPKFRFQSVTVKVTENFSQPKRYNSVKLLLIIVSRSFTE